MQAIVLWSPGSSQLRCKTQFSPFFPPWRNCSCLVIELLPLRWLDCIRNLNNECVWSINNTIGHGYLNKLRAKNYLPSLSLGLDVIFHSHWRISEILQSSTYHKSASFIAPRLDSTTIPIIIIVIKSNRCCNCSIVSIRIRKRRRRRGVEARGCFLATISEFQLAMRQCWNECVRTFRTAKRKEVDHQI